MLLKALDFVSDNGGVISFISSASTNSAHIPSRSGFKFSSASEVTLITETSVTITWLLARSSIKGMLWFTFPQSCYNSYLNATWVVLTFTWAKALCSTPSVMLGFYSPSFSLLIILEQEAPIVEWKRLFDLQLQVLAHSFNFSCKVVTSFNTRVRKNLKFWALSLAAK